MTDPSANTVSWKVATCPNATSSGCTSGNGRHATGFVSSFVGLDDFDVALGYMDENGDLPVAGDTPPI